MFYRVDNIIKIIYIGLEIKLKIIIIDYEKQTN